METLKTPYGIFNCYVNEVNQTDQTCYHISFVDKNNKTHTVLMNESGGERAITNSATLPSWVTQLQDQFNAMVERKVIQDLNVVIAG